MARDISTLEVIRAIDGPIILTHCFTEHNQKECTISDTCSVREPLRKVHEGILKLLGGITIHDLAIDESPAPPMPPPTKLYELLGAPAASK